MRMSSAFVSALQMPQSQTSSDPCPKHTFHGCPQEAKVTHHVCLLSAQLLPGTVVDPWPGRPLDVTLCAAEVSPRG